MSGLIRTKMMNRYMLKLAVRILIFLVVFFFYVTHKDLLCDLMTRSIWLGITPLHALWLVFMFMMVTHIYPVDWLTMALRKAELEQYQEVSGYSEPALYRFVQEQNIKAWNVMLVWLIFNAIFGFLYLVHILDNADLLMLTVFYFLCDYICILFYCPFQSLIMKNKCCINCRIYDWGHFMMFTPMLFIRNFFSWSLFFISCVVLIHWEVIYAKHPERFWSGSNQTLQCKHCKDKTCQIKKKLSSKISEF